MISLCRNLTKFWSRNRAKLKVTIFGLGFKEQWIIAVVSGYLFHSYQMQFES